MSRLTAKKNSRKVDELERTIENLRKDNSRLQEQLANTKEQLADTTMDLRYFKGASQELCVKLNKYEQLEKRIGCPLEVRCAVVPDSFIYTFGTSMENQDVVTQRHVVAISKEGFTIMYAAATGKERKMELSWKAYKKTWWLKENREE